MEETIQTLGWIGPRRGEVRGIMAPMADTWYRIKYHGHVYTRKFSAARRMIAELTIIVVEYWRNQAEWPLMAVYRHWIWSKDRHDPRRLLAELVNSISRRISRGPSRVPVPSSSSSSSPRPYSYRSPPLYLERTGIRPLLFFVPCPLPFARATLHASSFIPLLLFFPLPILRHSYGKRNNAMLAVRRSLARDGPRRHLFPRCEFCVSWLVESSSFRRIWAKSFLLNLCEKLISYETRQTVEGYRNS